MVVLVLLVETRDGIDEARAPVGATWIGTVNDDDCGVMDCATRCRRRANAARAAGVSRRPIPLDMIWIWSCVGSCWCLSLSLSLIQHYVVVGTSSVTVTALT